MEIHHLKVYLLSKNGDIPFPKNPITFSDAGWGVKSPP